MLTQDCALFQATAYMLNNDCSAFITVDVIK